MAAKVGGVFRHDDEVAFTHLDHPVAPGAQVALPGRVGLDRGDDLYPESAAHSTSATASRIVPTTMATSRRSFRCGRKGLKPMAAW